METASIFITANARWPRQRASAFGLAEHARFLRGALLQPLLVVERRLDPHV